MCQSELFSFERSSAHNTYSYRSHNWLLVCNSPAVLVLFERGVGSIVRLEERVIRRHLAQLQLVALEQLVWLAAVLSNLRFDELEKIFEEGIVSELYTDAQSGNQIDFLQQASWRVRRRA